MCTDYFYTRNETEEFLKGQPDVIEMFKVVDSVGWRHYPLYHCWGSDFYLLGLNVATNGEEHNRDSQGFHCFLSLQDALDYERSIKGCIPSASTISVYVNKEKVLYTGGTFFIPPRILWKDLDFSGDRHMQIAIVSELEIRDFSKHT